MILVILKLQALVMKSYPSKLLFTNLQCLLSAIQSFAIAIAVERDPREWMLGWNVRLLAVAYCVNIFLSNSSIVFVAFSFVLRSTIRHITPHYYGHSLWSNTTNNLYGLIFIGFYNNITWILLSPTT